MKPSIARPPLWAAATLALLLAAAGSPVRAQTGVWGEIAFYPPPGSWQEVDSANFSFIGMNSPIYRGWIRENSVIYAIAFESQGMNFLQMHAAREDLLRAMPEAQDLDVQVVNFNGKRFSWIQAAGPADALGSAKRNTGHNVVNIWAETVYKDYVVRFTLSAPVEKVAIFGPQFQAFMESVEFPFEARELTAGAGENAPPPSLTSAKSQPNPSLLRRPDGAGTPGALPPLPARGALDDASAGQLDRIELLLLQIKTLLEEMRGQQKTGP